VSEPNPNARPPQAFDLAFLTDLPDALEILLIRHGQQEVDVNGPFGLMIDPPLSEHGLLQAKLLGESLQETPIDAIYSSGLRWARQAAAAVAQHQGQEVIIIDDLREVEIFRDIPPDKSAAEFLGQAYLEGLRYRMMMEKSWDVYPYSETSADFNRRTINAIEGIIARHKSGRIAIVCHGGVINAYCGHVIGARSDMFFRPAHTAVNVVAAAQSRRAVQGLNDVTHLRTPEGHLRSH
jgi:2,3-bisphosphoglycerate-dependent phosphoglycerate mutase